MAYGFQIKDSGNSVVLDTSSIGIQVIHETTLTAASTDVTWVSEFSPFYFSYFSMDPNSFAQNVTWSDVTPSGAPTDSHTYRFVVKSAKTRADVRLVVMGGDAYTVSADGSGSTGGAYT